MKYKDFAMRFDECWNESDAPKTQMKLAKWLDYSQPMIHFWLNGEKLPSMDSAIKISEKFGVRVEWLLTGKGSKHSQEHLSIYELVDLSSISEEQKTALKILFKSLTPIKPTFRLAKRIRH